jgi:hypothetical protein
VSLPPGRTALEERLRAFAERLEGYELERVPRPFGHSFYLRWESRGVRRRLELQVADQDPAGVAVWATASKARKDRSLKLAALPPEPSPDQLEAALEEALAWVDLWKVQDFF